MFEGIIYFLHYFGLKALVWLTAAADRSALLYSVILPLPIAHPMLSKAEVSDTNRLTPLPSRNQGITNNLFS